MTSRNLYRFLILFTLLFIFFILDLFYVSGKGIHIDFEQLSNQEDLLNPLYYIRLPRALTALLSGMALSVSGLLMQTIFRNPLAGPFVLGISSGASVGLAVVLLGFPLFAVNSGVPSNQLIIIASVTGAFLVMLLMAVISMKVKDVLILLIVGILLASGTSALVTILQYFSNSGLVKAYVLWTMGSLGSVTNSQLNILWPVVVGGLLMSVISIKPLNAYLLGDNFAQSVGIRVQPARLFIFITTGVLAGSITAFCGPIGFVGIAVPHLARFYFKTNDHRIILPGSMLLGAIVMIFADFIAYLPGMMKALPINAITSVMGIPIVIFIVVRYRKMMAT